MSLVTFIYNTFLGPSNNPVQSPHLLLVLSSWSYPSSGTIGTYLVIAGGGGGGKEGGGGGGAGGMVEGTSHAVTEQTYAIVVGEGGAGVANNSGNAGENSTFSTITATGGGYGAKPAYAGGAGGSGGGAGYGDQDHGCFSKLYSSTRRLCRS